MSDGRFPTWEELQSASDRAAKEAPFPQISYAALVDEPQPDGVVALYDEDGRPIVWMPRRDYDAMCESHNVDPAARELRSVAGAELPTPPALKMNRKQRRAANAKARR